MPITIPGAMALSGGLGLLGSIFGASKSNQANLVAARETNEANIQMSRENNQFQAEQSALQRSFNHDEAILAYKRELEKMQKQWDYESPVEMMRRYREAGINPQVAFSQGSGSVSSAVGASSPMASASASGVSSSLPSLVTPHLEFPNFATGLGDMLLKFAQAKQAFASSGKQDTETEQLKAMFSEQMKKLSAEASLSTTMAQIKSQFGFDAARLSNDKVMQDIATSIQQAYKLSAEGKLAEANEALAHATEELRKSEKSVKDSEKQFFDKKIEWFDSDMRSQIAERAASADEKRASAADHISSVEARDASSWPQKAQNSILQALQVHDWDKFADYIMANLDKQVYENKGIKFDNELNEALRDTFIEIAKLDAVKGNPSTWQYYVDKVLSALAGMAATATSASINKSALLKAAKIRAGQ